MNFICIENFEIENTKFYKDEILSMLDISTRISKNITNTALLNTSQNITINVDVKDITKIVLKYFINFTNFRNNRIDDILFDN